jgi:alkanesulfonate monooxygenase SsuD/methylene tetrahydromethanopterin reductase-like flavin-dependent oxidoreductase (luciferase family)
MLRLVAQYAGQWNTAWLGAAKELPERLERIVKACSEVDRDPATLKVTVGVQASFPELGRAEPFMDHPLSGNPSDLARAFQEFEAAGADHLIIMHTPSTLPALERIVEGVRLYRS